MNPESQALDLQTFSDGLNPTRIAYLKHKAVSSRQSEGLCAEVHQSHATSAISIKNETFK